MQNMTAPQLLKLAVLTEAARLAKTSLPEITAGNIDKVYDDISCRTDCVQDACSELRSGKFETNVPVVGNRHYEATSVGMKMPNGVWVGWTYWHGGGKWGQPETVPWISEAYFLDCQETEQLTLVRTFSKKESSC